MLNSARQHAHRGRPPLVPAARVAAIAGLLLSVLVHPGAALAGPTGGQVVAGSGTIARPNVNTTLIQQQSQSLAIDWTGFDVASHELVRFQQPSSSAAVLNRIFNELPSQIRGSIQANGQVFIMNPNGVVFGPGARVEVGGLMASSLDIELADFMNGHYRFSAPGGGVPGAIINRGLIEAASGGVALLGGAVRNDGVIIADLGYVLMGAARQALVDFDGDGLIRFHVDGAILENVNQDMNEDGAVVNNGEIHADGGQVLLSAAVARGIVDSAVNNRGIIRAASIDRSSGTVRLSALGADVENSGTIDVSASEMSDAGSVTLISDAVVRNRGRIHADAADGDAGRVVLQSAGLTLLDTGSTISARSAGARGGEAHVLGDSVAMLDAATIDVSGGLGGGTVLVGGDYQGANPSIANARLTGVAAGAVIDADATATGDGGRVIVWSDATTSFFGKISARGGPSGGDGGFAEVSGKQHLAYRGSADLTAANGSRGTLLLDPAVIEITGGSGDGDGDGIDTFAGSDPGSVAGAILFSNMGPSVVYESEIEAQSTTANIALQATQSVSAVGSFDDGALTLAANSNLLIETRNLGAAEAGFIDLTLSSQGQGLDIVTSGSGTITVRSGVGGDQDTPIRLPNLISASDIFISAAGGSGSSVEVSGMLSGASVAIDATGLVTVLSGARLVARGGGTSLSVDATGIVLEDGTPGAATVSNIDTGTVSLTSSGAADIELGQNAIAGGAGLLSLSSGRSIIATNPTDLTDMASTITSAGAVSLRAVKDIGSDTNHIEIGGVNDLILDLGDGDFFVSGSDGAGRSGGALSSLTLSLDPVSDGNYVVQNFASQVFDFAQGGFGDNLVIRGIFSASLLDLSITTRNNGIFIGGTGGAGIQLAGASDVTLNSDRGIEEADSDDVATVVAEITSDGLLTLVANTDIGSGSVLDLAADATGVSALQATSNTGVVRVNGLDDLRVEGGGIKAAGGGSLVAGGALTIAADVEAGADMTFTAGNDGTRAGDDVTIAAGGVVRLVSGTPATLRFSAGDDMVFDGGRIQTSGAVGHRVELHADLENGGSDGVIGGISQTGIATSVSGGQLTVTAGGGIGAGTALRTAVATLSADNTTTGDVQVFNQGDVGILGSFRNQAPGGALTLINDNGAVDTGSAAVASNAGLLTLEARESNAAAAPGDRARITVGATGVRSAGGKIVVAAADSITVNGPVDSGGADAAIRAGLAAIEAVPDGIGDLRIAANLDTGAGALSLSAGSAIEQLATGRIAAASLRSQSGGATTLNRPANAVDRFAATAGGDVGLTNSLALAIGQSDVGGNLQIDNAQAVSVAGLVDVAGTVTLTSAAGNIDGAGGRIAAGGLDVDSAAGIGVGAVLDTQVSGDISLRSRGAAGDGDIHIRQQGNLATSQIQLLATDTDSVQRVSIAASNVLTVNKDPVDTPNLQLGDALELDASRIDLAGNISGKDVDVRFKGPVDVTGSSVSIDLDRGLLTFDENVSPGSNTTLTLNSEVVFGSGHVTGKPGSSLVISDTLNLVTDTTIEVDNLRLSGDPASLTGGGNLTLLPATNGKDIVIGGLDGLVPDVTLATLQGFGGGRALEIGVPALPATNLPFAGNVRVEDGLSVGDAVLTIGGLGDVTLDNHGDPLTSDRAIVIVAVGDRRVFPGLVSHRGGNILDTDASAGASATLKAPVVNTIAQGSVGVASNALEVAVGTGGRANFVTGASNAFINTVPGGESVTNIVGTSIVLAAFQAQGFFLDALNQAALSRTVGLETTGLETTGLGELLYLDEGVFLLPDPYTTPIQATLLPALADPDFPADRRPDDPDDEQAWQTFFAGVLKDYVQSRYLLDEDATASERAAVDARIESEWQSLVAYFQSIRARERVAILTGNSVPGSGG
ncbi:MAG: filamentous hemagglutinin N-terminal domain-containing protein [Alphaproteobacteria bacterium]|nr:filamentous hemagglutinin N-terminal domain-containing protein [Alphaproteobacteria bacterium]